jgi:hypothetical protein
MAKWSLASPPLRPSCIGGAQPAKLRSNPLSAMLGIIGERGQVDQALVIGESDARHVSLQQDLFAQTYTRTAVLLGSVDVGQEAFNGPNPVRRAPGPWGVECVAGHYPSEIAGKRRGLVKQVEPDHLAADGADDTDLVRPGNDLIEFVGNPEFEFVLDIVKGLGV